MAEPETISFPLWPDNPTAEDLLGFADVAEPIVDALKRDRLDPVAVGVSGDWGSGKTTVLEIIKASLESDESIVVVYTRPWEYDPATDPKATLIAEVLGAIQERAEKLKDGGLSDKLKGAFATLRDRVKWSKAITLAAKTAITVSPPSFEQIIDIFDMEGSEAADPTLQGFREEFSDLMEEIDEISRVVVLVDDLDRCLPESVVGTLEAVKLFLSVKKMGFVIAADERLVTHAISQRYLGSPQAERMAREYLEKIVQIPIRVPALGESDTEAYLALLLVRHYLFADLEEDKAIEQFEKIAGHCAARRAASHRRLLDDMPEDLIPAEAADEVALSRQLAPVLAGGISGNPRKVKRFLNAFWLRADIAQRRGIALEGPALAKLLVLEQLEPTRFDLLLSWLNAGTLKATLGKLEDPKSKDLDADEGSLVDWAKREPKLSEKDLGPYLRLAASFKAMPSTSTDLRSELQELLERLVSDAKSTRDGAQEDAKTLPVPDKIELVKEAVALIQAEPGRQDDISQSLLALADEKPVAEELGRALAGVDASVVEASLIIRLQGLGPVKATISKWVESGRLEASAAEAVDGAGG